MKHVVLLTHGHLCEGFASALQVISGSDNPLTLLCMEAPGFAGHDAQPGSSGS